MAHIGLDKAAAGMVLAAEVFDKRGRLLVPAGHEITERHLGAFRMWGVETLEIEGDGPEPDEQPDFDPALLEEANGLVEDLFSNAGPEHPFLDELKKLARVRAAERLHAAAADREVAP